MTVDLQNHIAAAGEHLGSVIRLMIEGVAFPMTGGKTYQVISHEGDDIGFLSTADISYAISFMKQRGRKVGKLRHTPTNFNPAFSFAWEDWHWLDR